jgi:hypothetical protein
MSFPGTDWQAGALPERRIANSISIASITDAPNAGARWRGTSLSANSTMS